MHILQIALCVVVFLAIVGAITWFVVSSRSRGRRASRGVSRNEL
jgi:flagellar basal body-associated protein FliL